MKCIKCGSMRSLIEAEKHICIPEKSKPDQGINTEVAELRAEIERLLDLSSGIMKLTGMNGLEGQLAAEQAKSQKLVAALEATPCACKYRPFTHQYISICARCEALAEYRSGK